MSEIKIEFNISGKEIIEKYEELFNFFWDNPYSVELLRFCLDRFEEVRKALKPLEAGVGPPPSQPFIQKAPNSQENQTHKEYNHAMELIGDAIVDLNKRLKGLEAKIEKLEGKNKARSLINKIDKKKKKVS